jgi:hypothetical protein
MLTFYIYKTFFPWWVSEGNIKYLKNQTRSLCSIKPLHAKYGRSVVKICYIFSSNIIHHSWLKWTLGQGELAPIVVVPEVSY